MVATLLAKCRYTVHEGSSHKGEVCTVGHGFRDVRSRPKPAVDHNFHPIAVFFSQALKWLDGGFACVDLTPAMVGHDYPVRADSDALLHVLVAHYAFDDELSLPLITDCLDFIRVYTTGERCIHKLAELGHV